MQFSSRINHVDCTKTYVFRKPHVDGIGDSAIKTAPPPPFFALFWCNLSVWCGGEPKGHALLPENVMAVEWDSSSMPLQELKYHIP